ncbi:UDP-N-acetylmuramoyl-tripeptide--D-alanyl-D-alanine ligase [Arthrobacter psychrolactophilus]|uniref:UDP-N-acetylmuramoyl-tripeptide--D-alanyl-D-alanine ligase n=1 Tax=Arthrobacter psychrolactophilus TaxID=92442 RepID=A0A2V5IRD2_9MICC|nr:UDP-N-acetylmuramoyl-tripeptide--D-alanyl-D-alanine ligase [Arthrobacter psychrolactophilus]PYI38581.1 UDP-N-acetylmuramoyl-tripeptide--D-alanyl-D-alanine ligase [Arthrobacter psychrolactophilus]
MIEFSAAQIAELTGGTLTAGTDPATSIEVASIATDSREVIPGGLYVAKAGENADGHDFMAPAFAAGAVLALAEREVLADDAGTPFPAVIVADAVLAMGTLAAEVVRQIRAHSPLTVIGITGSAGKTTTKDLLEGILSAAGATVAPIGSYNGEVGVPLTVFRAVEDTRYLIIEMGATKIGHIAYLSGMVHPDLGVVLGVGSAHAGEFGSIDNIATAKGELVEALTPAGRAILNFDDGRVRAMAQRSGAPVTFFSSADAAPDETAQSTVQARNVRTNAEGEPEFDLLFPGEDSEYQVHSKLLGLHHVTNLLAAASAAHVLGISAENIVDSLNEQRAASRYRMERTDRSDGVSVINDAYNANPESMRAALRTLAELGGSGTRRTWAVLGEMLELGEDSVLEHDAVGRVAVRLNISRLIVVGAGARAMHVGAVMEGSWGDESMFLPDAEAAYELLSAELAPGDVVLFKSSNGAGLRFLGDRIALPTGNIPTKTSEPTPGERTVQP